MLAEQFQSVDSRNYVLLHNDLHPGNIAYDSLNERVNGVFDFTNAALGDLAIDFTSLFSIDVDLVQRVVRAYSQLSGCEGLFRRVLSMRVLILSMQILKAQERGDKVRALKKMDALSNMVSIWYAEEEKKASISRR